MAYNQTNRFSAERASKIGHLQLITDTQLRHLLQGMERSAFEGASCWSGSLDLLQEHGIQQIVTVDGGECYPSNLLYPEHQMAFINISAVAFKVLSIDRLRKESILDPRACNQIFRESMWQYGGAIPLAGVRIPGRSVRETVRASVDAILQYSNLYSILEFLVSREWNPGYKMGRGKGPHFACQVCGKTIYLPRSCLTFPCPSCQYIHRLSDYLQIDRFGSEEWIQGETVQALRNVLEILTLIHCIRALERQPEKLNATLFIRDGPLLMRAGLYRLVDDIRAYIQSLSEKGLHPHLVGIEKTGAMVTHGKLVSKWLPENGDFFLPTFQYVAEEIYGRPFNPRTYRNRGLFGVKLFARLGPHHLCALNIPARNYIQNPQPEDLLGLQAILSALSGMLSYQYENALIPIVVANRFASLSEKFSGRVLDAFAGQLISGGDGLKPRSLS